MKKKKTEKVIPRLKVNRGIQYAEPERETLLLLPVAVPSGNETQEEAQKRLLARANSQLLICG